MFDIQLSFGGCTQAGATYMGTVVLGFQAVTLVV